MNLMSNMLQRKSIGRLTDQDVQQEIFPILKNLYTKMLPLVLFLCIMSLAASMVQTIAGKGSYLFFAFQLCLYMIAVIATIAFNRVNGVHAYYLLLLPIYLMSLAALLNRGLAGTGILHMIFFCVLSGLYLGLRKGMILLAVSVATLVVIGGVICTGLHEPWSESSHYLYNPINWLIQISCFVMYAVPLILSAKGLHLRMAETQRELKEKNKRLEDEIAGRQGIEGKLRESEENYRSIFEHAIEGMFQSSGDGRLHSVNPALVQMMGYASPEEMIAAITDIEKQVYFDEGERLRLGALLRSEGKIVGYETRMYRKDRSVIWVSLNGRAVCREKGKVGRFEGSIVDITRHKQAEAALVESEAKYRSVVESQLAGFFISQDRIFRFVNRRACEMTGYACDEIVNVMGPTDAVHPDDRKRVAEKVAQCLATDGEVIQFDARLIQKNGKTMTVQIFISTIQYNNAIAVSGTFIDITREKVLESQLRQAQKMEAIGQLAGGIAHDFNNILTAFNGYGSILQIKMSKEDPLRIYVDHILSAAQKASSLTQSLLTFSRQQPINLTPMDINQGILGTETLLRRVLTEDIAFDVHLSSDAVTILADATQIDQILFNLVTNGRDAMPQGGRLTLETRLAVLDDEFTNLHGFGKPGRYVCVSLSDTGTGIDKSILDKIFDPFFTTKEMGRGTGLGLATVYGIVKQHNGYIIVESEPGRGTTFQVYFPTTNAAVENEDMAPVYLKTGSETILIAEDSEDVRDFIRDVLGISGYKTVEAVDGEDAVMRFREADHIDLVILDSVMPKKNGREVLDEIMKVNPHVKALFISGYTRDVIIDKGIGYKEFNFLKKPLSPAILLDKVREILDERP